MGYEKAISPLSIYLKIEIKNFERKKARDNTDATALHLYKIILDFFDLK